MKRHSVIKKGTYVRFVNFSYYEMSKSEYNNYDYLNKPTENDTNIMLGGEYFVEDIVVNKWHVKELVLSCNGQILPFTAPLSLFVSKLDLHNCTFQINDKVIFSPDLSEEDEDYLNLFLPIKRMVKEKEILSVSKIINDYYILVENSDQNVIDFPFLWTDFVKL